MTSGPHEKEAKREKSEPRCQAASFGESQSWMLVTAKTSGVTKEQDNTAFARDECRKLMGVRIIFPCFLAEIGLK